MAELKKAEAAKLLGVSERSIERAVSAKKLHPRKERRPGGGDVLYFDEDELRAWHSAPKVERTYQEVERRPDDSTAVATVGAVERIMSALAPALTLDSRGDSRSVGARLDRKLALTIPEAAEHSGLGRGTIERAIADGRLVALPVGAHGARVVRRADVEELVDALFAPSKAGRSARGGR